MPRLGLYRPMSRSLKGGVKEKKDRENKFQHFVKGSSQGEVPPGAPTCEG